MAKIESSFIGSTFNNGKLTIYYNPDNYENIIITVDNEGDNCSMAQISFSTSQAKAVVASLQATIIIAEKTKKEEV